MQKKSYVKETKISESQYNGYPLLCFEGQFRPFKLGRKKVEVILANLDRVREFHEKCQTLPMPDRSELKAIVAKAAASRARKDSNNS